MSNILQKNRLIKFFLKEHLFSFHNRIRISLQGPPYDLELQKLCSYPKQMKLVARQFGGLLKQIPFDIIAGPYTDIPLATTISLEHNWPMVFVRGERKDHGTERLVEGNFVPGQRAVIVDDEVRDIGNVLRMIGRLEGSGIRVVGVYVLFDREQGALKLIQKKGYECEALIHLSDVLINLSEKGKIRVTQRDQFEQYLKKNRREFLTKFGISSIT